MALAGSVVFRGFGQTAPGDLVPHLPQALLRFE